jgi:predicted ferric reductase
VGLPLVLAWLIDPLPSPRPVIIDVGVGLGFIGLALLLIQFALVSRLRPVSRPFGGDVLMLWHRGMGIAGLLFVLAHPLLVGASWRAWNPLAGPAAMQTGALALWATVVIVITSVARARLHLSYEAWQVIHLAAACLITAAALWHVFALGTYSRAAPLRVLLAAYAVLFATLVVRYRVIRPLGLGRHPWHVVANEDIGGSVRLVRVRPDGHHGFRFEAGQFAWLMTGASPMLSAQHPLSIASSAVPNDAPALEFAIKALGDWSARAVPALAPGRRVWVDGPYGGFTPDPASRRPIVIVAGGIGIAPARSILLTMRDRDDRRPVHLFYAASGWTRVVFRREIEQLADILELTVCYVFEKPDPEWTGERGFITADTLTRHLPADVTACEYFVCGPIPMIDALERILTALRVPGSRIHTERFQMV